MREREGKAFSGSVGCVESGMEGELKIILRIRRVVHMQRFKPLKVRYIFRLSAFFSGPFAALN